MYYDIIYKRKSDAENQEWKNIRFSTLDNTLTQLKRLSTSFNGNIVFWINDLAYLKIIERNYAYFRGGFYLENGTAINHKWQIVPIYSKIDEISKKTWVSENELMQGGAIERDATNELLHKYEICWDDYKKVWKVILEDNILYANTYEFKLESWKKIYELFDLIFRAKEFYKKLIFTYDELKFVYKNSGVKYEELQPYLNKENIDDILWKKLRDIRTKTWMKNKIIENNWWFVSIRQETAL